MYSMSAWSLVFWLSHSLLESHLKTSPRGTKRTSVLYSWDFFLYWSSNTSDLSLTLVAVIFLGGTFQGQVTLPPGNLRKSN